MARAAGGTRRQGAARSPDPAVPAPPPAREPTRARVPGAKAANTFAIFDLAADGEGGVLAVTAGKMTGFERPSLTRVDSTGEIVWSTQIAESALHPSVGRFADGDILVSGTADSACLDGSNVALWRFASDGSPRGQESWRSPMASSRIRRPSR